MGSPYLNVNESIILATHRVMVKSVSSDVILTNQRLIFVDSQNSRFVPQTIPLVTIETVMARESAGGDPGIAISIAAETRNDPTQSLELTFSRWEAEERVAERDDWIINLKSRIASARDEAKRTGSGSSDSTESPAKVVEQGSRTETQAPDALTAPKQEITELGAIQNESSAPGNVPVVMPKPAPGNEYGKNIDVLSAVSPQSSTPLSERFHPRSTTPPKGPSKKIPLLAVIGIICIIAGTTIGIIFFSDIAGGKPGLPVTPVETPIPSSLPTATQIPSQTTALMQTSLPEQSPSLTPVTTQQPQFIVPQTGVWVRVNYNGNFTGSYGTPGRMHAATSSGNHFYQVPALNDTVEAMFQKLDGSGNILMAEVYRNGVVVGKDTTSAPTGLIDLHVDLSKT